MSETVSSPELLVKVIKFPEADLLICSRLSASEEKSVLDEFCHGLPANYVSWGQKGNFVDSVDNPTLMVKQRLLGAEDLRSFRNRGKYASYTALDMNASISLMNEFQMTEEASKILATKEALGFAQENGYTGISLVKPLVGIITRPEGNKYMVYPFIKGGKSWCKLNPGMWAEDKAPVQDLREIFERHGIDPVDLVAKQIMIVGNQMVLLDLELYHRIPKRALVK